MELEIVKGQGAENLRLLKEHLPRFPRPCQVADKGIVVGAHPLLGRIAHVPAGLAIGRLQSLRNADGKPLLPRRREHFGPIPFGLSAIPVQHHHQRTLREQRRGNEKVMIAHRPFIQQTVQRGNLLSSTLDTKPYRSQNG